MNLKKEKKGLYIVIIIALIILFILRKDFNGVIDILLKINIKWLVLGFSMMMFYWILEAYIYKLFFISSLIKIKFIELLKVVLITQFFNGVTPFSTGGQPFQIYILNKKVKSTYGRITSITMQNFIVYQIALVIYSFFLILYNLFFARNLLYFNNKIRLFILVGFVVNFLLIIFFIMILKSTKISKKIVFYIIKFLNKIHILKNVDDKIEKSYHFLEEFEKNEKELSSKKLLFIITIIINILKFIIYFAISYILCLSVGLNNISFIAVQLASCYTLIVIAMVPLPGASGGAEIGFLVFFSTIISGSVASAIMILWRFFTYYLGLFLGFIFTIFELNNMIETKEQ